MIHLVPRVVLTILACAIVNFCSAQNWQALNPPLNLFNGTIYATTTDSSGNIYAGGEFKNSSHNRFVAKWNGTGWNELGTGLSALNANGPILALSTFGDTIYAAGGFLNNLSKNYVARWDGAAWRELDSSSSLRANGLIYSIAVDKSGNVYAAGRFTNGAGKNYVAKWNGHSWKELGIGAGALNANNDIFAIAVDAAGNVYAGGNFTNTAGEKYIAKWDGNSWTALGSVATLLNAHGFIYCLATDKIGNVYAGGDFRNSNNEYCLVKWNGASWTETGNGTHALHANGSIKTIAVNNKNEIYVAGYFTDATGNYSVAKWDGISWLTVNNYQSPFQLNESIQSIAIDVAYNLYAGGKFLNKSGHSFVAKWNGTDWNDMGSKGDPFYSSAPIYQVVADSFGHVYVSGYLLDNDGRFYLQHWNGSGWEQLQTPYTSGLSIYLQNNGGFRASHQMAVDRKGNLYVTGRRTISFDKGYDCILKWDGVQWSILEDFQNSLKAVNHNSVYGLGEIEIGPDGNIYVAGSFNDSAYGLCSLAKWDGKTWSRLPGSGGEIDQFCVAGDGNIYAYGGFVGQSGRVVISNYNPAVHFNWQEVKSGNTSLGVPGFNVFSDLAIDSNNNLYVSGDFTNSAGKRYIAKWDGRSWSELGTTRTLGRRLGIDHNGNIYTNDGEGSPEASIIKWNGTSWVGISVPVGTNGPFPNGIVFSMDAAGNIYTDAPSNEPGVGSFIVKYAPVPSLLPKLVSFTPVNGSLGTTVTITGKNLTGTASVYFGGTKAASFIVKNDSTVAAVVANGATGSITVITTGGSDSLRTFTFTCDSIKGPVPYIYLTRDTILESTYSDNYQWFYNNVKLMAATTNSLRVTDAGFYHVETSTDKICWVPSLDYFVLLRRTPLSDSLKLNIYPNPSNGSFTVDVKLPRTTTVKTYVQVLDANGIIIQQTSKLIFYGNEIKIPISISSKGTFGVKIFVNDDAVQQSVIVL